jgi:hypothetical protein
VAELWQRGILAREHPLYEAEWLRRSLNGRTALSAVLLGAVGLFTLLVVYVPLTAAVYVLVSPAPMATPLWLPAVGIAVLAPQAGLELLWLRRLACGVDLLTMLEEIVPTGDIREMRLEPGGPEGLLRASHEPIRDLLRRANHGALPVASLLRTEHAFCQRKTGRHGSE